ncbi:CBS domain-containing protein [Besnoitia besnoiti]|uniref:CBS domain-containing protein n=1 Tax=Besnoitia besnoiti TaxID=94643 RepID=A0A2A9M1L7_BESBE|nr:CBS domain-containing protein [Besnoitia besnoiti]PFH32388.1 CBS domain-containing protein [Besnoitia besnoiti]
MFSSGGQLEECPNGTGADPPRDGGERGAARIPIIPGLLFQHLVQFYSQNEVVDVTPGLTTLLVLDNRLFVSTALQVRRSSRQNGGNPALHLFLLAGSEGVLLQALDVPVSASTLSSHVSLFAGTLGCGRRLSSRSTLSSVCARQTVALQFRDRRAPRVCGGRESEEGLGGGHPAISPATLGAAAFAGSSGLPSSLASQPPREARASPQGDDAGPADPCEGRAAASGGAAAPRGFSGSVPEGAGSLQTPPARVMSSRSLPENGQRGPSCPSSMSCLRMRRVLAQGVGAQGVWLYDESAKLVAGFMDEKELVAFFICWAHWLRERMPQEELPAETEKTPGRSATPRRGGALSSSTSGKEGNSSEETQAGEADRGREGERDGCGPARSGRAAEAANGCSGAGASSAGGCASQRASQEGRERETERTEAKKPQVSQPAGEGAEKEGASSPSSSPPSTLRPTETMQQLLRRTPPPWTWTLQQWRAFYKTPSPVLYIHPDRPPIDALLLQLQNRTATVALWNAERQTPMVVLTLCALLAHAVQHLRGDLPEFELSVQQLQVGTYRDIVTVDVEDSVLDAVETINECDISAVPVVDSRGAYVGCFTRQNFLLLALQAIHNGTPLDVDQPVGDALKQLRYQENRRAQQLQANAAAAQGGKARPLESARPSNSLPSHQLPSSQYPSVYSSSIRDGRAGFSGERRGSTYASAHSQSFGGASQPHQHVAADGSVFGSVVRQSVGGGSAPLSRSASRESRCSSRNDLPAPAVSIREAILRVLFSPYRRIIFLDSADRVSGVVTATDLAGFLVGSGQPVFTFAGAEDCSASFQPHPPRTSSHELNTRCASEGDNPGSSSKFSGGMDTSRGSAAMAQEKTGVRSPVTSDPTRSTATPETVGAEASEPTDRPTSSDRLGSTTAPAAVVELGSPQCSAVGGAAGKGGADTQEEAEKRECSRPDAA